MGNLEFIPVFSNAVDFLVIRNLRRLQELDGEISGLVVQLINGVAKLRLAQAEDRAFAAWAQKYSDRMKWEAGLQRLQDGMEVFNESLSLVSSAVLYWFGVVSIQMAQANEGSGLTIGTFLAFNAALGIFSGAVSSISTTVTDILGIVPLWERAKPILQTKPEYEPHRVNPGQLQSGVVLERVTFRYRDEGLPVLDDITLCAQPGEFVAIVGPSGSGKSTIVRLLLGFETPNSGRVYYDGKDLASLDLVAVRRQLGVVLQSGRIGSGSIFENITAGALVSHEKAWEAARMAGFAEDIGSSVLTAAHFFLGKCQKSNARISKLIKFLNPKPHLLKSFNLVLIPSTIPLVVLSSKYPPISPNHLLIDSTIFL